MNTILYQLDCFKTPLTYRINGRRSFYTRFGCLMSVPLLFIMVVSFFLSDFFLKKHPNITIQTTTASSSPYISFDIQNMTFAFSLVHQNQVLRPDPSLYSLEITNYVMNNTSNEAIRANVKQTKFCEEKDFNDPKIFSEHNLLNSTCVYGNSSFQIGGSTNDEIQSYIKIALIPCKNGSVEGLVCKSSSEILSYMKNNYFHIHHNDRNYNLHDFSSPISTYYTSQFLMTDPLIRKRMILYFKKAEFTNDLGSLQSLYENTMAEESFIFDKRESDFSSDNSEVLFEAYIYASKETLTMIRRYQKLTDICASLGGISNFIVFLELMIVMTVREYSLMKTLVNFLFSFPQKEKNKKNRVSEKSFDDLDKADKGITINQEKIIESLENLQEDIERIPTETPNIPVFPSFSSKPTSTIFQKSENENKFMNGPAINIRRKIRESAPVILSPPDFQIMGEIKIEPASAIPSNRELTKKKKWIFFWKKKELDSFGNFAQYQKIMNKKQKLNLGFWDYLMFRLSLYFKCIRRNRKQRLFAQAQKKAMKQMDFFNILKKIQEFDKLKLILLSPEQNKLFSLLSKPLIFDEDEVTDETERKGGYKIGQMMKNSDILKNNQDIQEILRYYESIKSNPGSEVEERLLILINKSLEEFDKLSRQ